MKGLEPVSVKPLGVVRNAAERRRYDEWSCVVSEIHVESAYVDALHGLGDFSHIYVLFYLHEMDRPFVTRIHPTGDPELPQVGAFATRTPNRPSRIALTLCRLLSVEGGVLKVLGLDAYDGSPVLDVKPYTLSSLGDVRQPPWVERVREKMEKPR